MSAPAFTSPANGFVALWTANAAHSLDFALSGDTPITLTATGQPSGVSVSYSNDWHLAGTPATPGFYRVTVTATNASGSASTTVYLNVGSVFPAAPSTTQNLTQGQAFSYVVPVSPGPGRPSGWDGVDNLPPGVSFDATTGTFSGTPTTAGNFSVAIAPLYGNRRGSGTVNFAVALAAGGISVSPATLAGNVGTPVNFQVPITGTPTSVTSSAALPAGLSLSSAGLITGTPTGVADVTTTITATNSGGASASAAVHLVISGAGVAPSQGDDPNLVVQINLVSGEATIINGSASAFYGDEIVIEVDFVPPDLAGNVNAVSFLLKEKAEVQQYQVLLSGAGNSTDGTTFLFPVTAVVGRALLHSLLLLDAVSPSDAVAYSLQFLYRWSGRVRKSTILDFGVDRPEDLDPAELAALTPGEPDANLPGLTRLSWRPDLTNANDGTASALSTQPTRGLAFGSAVAFAYGGYGGQFCVYEWTPDLTGGNTSQYPDSLTRFHPQDYNLQTNNGVWVRIL